MNMLRDFSDFKENTPTGRIQTWKFTGRHALHKQNLMDENVIIKLSQGGLEYSLYKYIQHFTAAIKRTSLFYERDISNDLIQKASKKYGVSKNAIYNQIHIIRMYLFRLTLVQFQMNISKYLFNYYFRRLLRFSLQFEPNANINDSGFVQTQMDTSVFYITPNNGEVFKKYNDSRVRTDDLVSFFGENTRQLFSFDKEDDIEIFKFRINKFCSFVNANL